MLSKSKLIAFRQCEKRLWLEIHRPQMREDSQATQASFGVGDLIGHLARQIYDPAGEGVFIDVDALGFAKAFEETQKALAQRKIVFEAGFNAGGALSFADVMLPTRTGWRMVEVKSSTQVKEYYRDDAAIQRWIAERSGIKIDSLALAHVDTSFVYPGDGRYAGLLKEVDLSAETAARGTEVEGWVKRATAVATTREEPRKDAGTHCNTPYPCGFFAYCNQDGAHGAAEFPVTWLPKPSAALKEYIAKRNLHDMREVPDEQLNIRQQRVKQCTLRNEEWLDAPVAGKLPKADGPQLFLDFETIGFAAPIWTGCRPFEQIPFQFSLHTIHADGRIEIGGFLDLSGANPARAFAEALVAQCGTEGPIFVYNAATEGGHIRKLAEQFPDLCAPLTALHARLFDLLPLARDHYYHPAMQGSWSIKQVLPAIAPELDYANLGDVKDGGMAQHAYLEAIAPTTAADKKSSIAQALQEYCTHDTWAMVMVWRKLAGRLSS